MIFLECDNDEAVVRGLGFPRAGIDHHASKGRVVKALQKASGSGHLGLVDQDPGAGPPSYLREFTVVKPKPDLALVLYRHSQEHKLLIEIQPDLEPWLYRAARQCGMKPRDFHLPERHEQLHDNPKTYAVRLREFVSALLQAECPHLCTLRQWLKPG